MGLWKPTPAFCLIDHALEFRLSTGLPLTRKTGRTSDEQRQARAASSAFLLAWEKPYCPSIREISDGCGIKSPGNAWYWLWQLRSNGIIDYEDGKNRTIRIRRAQ